MAYHAPRKDVYGTAARGFKAGGFNAASPAGSEAYGEEHSWNYEGGVKTSWLGERLSVNAAVFYLNWSDLQVNVPNPFVPAQFYIANAGSATSKGVELELTARPRAGARRFRRRRLHQRALRQRQRLGRDRRQRQHRLSNAPDFTADVGVQYSRVGTCRAATVMGAPSRLLRLLPVRRCQHRGAERVLAGQLPRRRARQALFVEGWVRNAFDTRYVPTAFAYPGLAPSGFIGESGPPRRSGSGRS